MKQFYTLFLVVITIAVVSCQDDKDMENPVDPFDTTKVEVTYSDPIYQDHGSKLVGVSTSSFSDANLTTESILMFNPHFMRYYLGSTIVFDESNKPNGIASVSSFDYSRNGELSNQMAANMDGWKYTPALNFDEFIALCKASNAEPVILLPVYAAYASTPDRK